MTAVNTSIICSINLILPPDTGENEAGDLFAAMEDIMNEYRINKVSFVCPVDETAYNTIIAKEELYKNNYFNSDDGTVKWYNVMSR